MSSSTPAPARGTESAAPRARTARPDADSKAPIAKRKKRLHVRVDLAEGGALHVRHLRGTDPDVFLCGGIPLPTSTPAAGEPVWIEIAKPGRFLGHPAGPFELDDRIFREIISNFEATENRSVPIDFEHASESDPASGSIPSEGAPAQGWIRGLKVERGSLWGLVEWLAKAREYIRARQYRYFSPAIRFRSKDRVTGKPIGARLTSGALTNAPFIDGMAPLVAHDRSAAAMVQREGAAQFAYSPDEYMPALRSALRLPELSTAHDCGEALERLAVLHEARGGRDLHGVPVTAYVTGLREAVRWPLSGTASDLFQAVRAMIRAAAGEDAGEEADEAREHAEEGDGGDGDARGGTGNDNAEDEATGEDVANEGGDEREEIMTTERVKELEGETTRLQADKAKLVEEKAALLSEKQSLSTEGASLTLHLKEAQSQVTKLEGDVARLEGEVKTLSDAQREREAHDIQERVNLAYFTYKDAKKLSDQDREAMLTVCTTSPAAFERLYPRIEHPQLLRELTTHREPGGRGASPPLRTETISSLTQKLMSERRLSYPDAQCEAERLLRQQGA